MLFIKRKRIFYQIDRFHPIIHNNVNKINNIIKNLIDALILFLYFFMISSSSSIPLKNQCHCAFIREIIFIE